MRRFLAVLQPLPLSRDGKVLFFFFFVELFEKWNVPLGLYAVNKTTVAWENVLNAIVLSELYQSDVPNSFLPSVLTPLASVIAITKIVKQIAAHSGKCG